jgi:ribosome recycling factor
MYDFSTLSQKIEETKDWLKREYAGIRTGRATPAILDGVRVESYGSMMPLNQVAGITVEDARTVRVAPWDQSQVRTIEKAIEAAALGVSLATDEKGVRVNFPHLTSERREQLLKLTRSKLEEARVALRHERDHVWNDIQQKEKNDEMSEDDKFRAKEDMQKHIDRGNTDLEALAAKKETELNE